MTCDKCFPKIVVVGAGVIGLSTAVNILMLMPDASIHIVAEKFDQETTSWGSGGTFKPHDIGRTLASKVHRWSEATFAHYQELIKSYQPQEIGILPRSLKQFWTGGAVHEWPFWSDIVMNFRDLSYDEVQRYVPRAFCGWTYDTFVTDDTCYMTWLTNQLQAKNCTFEQRKIENFQDLAQDGYDVVVNCTGIGAKDLDQDDKVFPVRGQLVQVEAPYVTDVWFIDNDTYMIPHEKVVILGGTRQKDNWNLSNSEQDVEDIVERNCELFPQLKEAKIIKKWTGLRPSRTEVRVESKTIEMRDGSQMNIVHNYGHGAWGVTLHWGCALEAAALVQTLVEQL
eukprot:TRINITY_DN57_c0_g1_i1.p1 TRINITY_DN57_c0_g1~~TRINITY_DN57_c0_g1_i1.p1  ORF type:complete len:373 (+),score=19.88 TRINITY_DN57_c0_g1_i1:105-1121(+)